VEVEVEAPFKLITNRWLQEVEVVEEEGVWVAAL